MTNRIKLTKAKVRFLEKANERAKAGFRGALAGKGQGGMVHELLGARLVELVDVVSFIDGKRCDDDRPVYAITGIGLAALLGHTAKACAQ